MKRKLIVIASGIGIIFLSILLGELLSDQKKATKIKKTKVSNKVVETRKVNYDDLKTEITTYGRVETAQTVDLLSEVSGRMFQGNLRLKEGQRFKKGTLLFYVDDQEAALDLKSQKSNFLRDLAEIIPNIKVDFNENFEAWRTYFNSLDIDKKFEALPKHLSEKEKTFLATKGIYSAYYSIKSAEVRLAKYRYYAPFSGSITKVTMQSGSFVNAGTNIGTIIRAGVHELRVTIDTKDIPWIQQNAPVKVYSDETQQYWNGKVTRISDYVNQNTQSVDVFVAIEPSDQRIYDGQFFRAAIPSRTVKNGMIMPRNAIYDGNEVFVVENDTMLRVKTVQVIRLTEEEAIFNGLSEGTDLVIEPLIGAHNNMRVVKRERTDIDLELKGDGSGKKAVGAEASPTNPGSE